MLALSLLCCILKLNLILLNISTAYYQLLNLADKNSSIRVTLNLFGSHFHIYRNRDEMCHVLYSEEDKLRIKAHYWGDLHPFTPHIPIERFVRALAPTVSY